ncbi:MAG: malate synthase A [Thermoplasmataceae archaeon]
MSQDYDTQGVQVLGRVTVDQKELLGKECLQFLGELCTRFSGERSSLIAARKEKQDRIDRGVLPDFSAETADIRATSWKVDPVPDFLLDRRVEITGPSGDAKMVINAFNSGAKVYMSDFEDAQSPVWKGMIQGQRNLYDSVRGDLHFRSDDGKEYSINDKPSVLFVRPRGLHLDERHVFSGGRPVPGSFFDFAVFLFNNAKEQIRNGYSPCFYIPKTEGYLEARLWDRIFSFSESYLGIRAGTIKATFLIETLPAAFEMDEILHEVRNHSAGLNCGRWDYIFSYIKKLRNGKEFLLPDRSSVTMDRGFLLSYSKLLIRTCHMRGAHAMGGMSAYIPVKNDEAANRKAMKNVADDKIREVLLGHDGTWVAHPGLVGVAMETFDGIMKTPNQIHVIPDHEAITASDLLKPIHGNVTEAGLRVNLRVGIQYIAAWLEGRGAVPLYNLMEDAATAEICRSQVWQWIRHGALLEDGRIVTGNLVEQILRDEVGKLNDTVFTREAEKLFREMIFSSIFTDFLTTGAYERLLELEVPK